MAPQQLSTPPREHTDGTGLRSALWLPIFDELADPAVVARLAAEAEQAGWHGVFVWDHLRWRAPVRQVADPWITPAAIATATQQVRLGPMVTPLAGRRPVKVARETATLDRLSRGRLTLGVGLGSDRFGSDFPITGEELPVLVANGEADRMVPSSNSVDLARRLPNAQLTLYKDAGHGGIFQYHEDFVPRVLEF